MKSFMLAGLASLSCLAVLVAVAPAKAMMIAPPPVTLRAATADLVVVGKVTGFGDKAVPAERFKGDTAQYQIAIVKVEETLVGKGVKEVKVAFVPPMPVAPPPPGGGVRPFIRRRPQANLTVGQEACLFLVKHPTKDFYTLNNYYDVLNKKDNPNFGTETGEIKRVARLLANPRAGLTSKDREERFQTASLLITRYRTPRPNTDKPKLEPVDAAQSKLILEALADADWTAPTRPGAFMTTPQAMFSRLNLTPADGWVQPKDYKEFPAEAKKWLKANAGKYRIQRYASAVREEEPNPEK